MKVEWGQYWGYYEGLHGSKADERFNILSQNLTVGFAEAYNNIVWVIDYKDLKKKLANEVERL